ncbi:hypothetical protein JTB14_020324 [Gonioctena quinquepunctata]|nr:hypothetical protein JTB14_020324 [Gonioctena quinquepunctata]
MEQKSSRSLINRKSSKSPVENKPSRIFPNPFFNFLKNFRKSNKHKLSVVEITKRGGQLWRRMSAGEKSPYIKLARQAPKYTYRSRTRRRNRRSRSRSRSKGRRKRRYTDTNGRVERRGGKKKIKYGKGHARRHKKGKKSGIRRSEGRRSRFQEDHESGKNDDGPAKDCDHLL